LLFDLQV